MPVCSMKVNAFAPAVVGMEQIIGMMLGEIAGIEATHNDINIEDYGTFDEGGVYKFNSSGTAELPLEFSNVNMEEDFRKLFADQLALSDKIMQGKVDIATNIYAAAAKALRVPTTVAQIKLHEWMNKSMLATNASAIAQLELTVAEMQELNAWFNGSSGIINGSILQCAGGSIVGWEDLCKMKFFSDNIYYFTNANVTAENAVSHTYSSTADGQAWIASHTNLATGVVTYDKNNPMSSGMVPITKLVDRTYVCTELSFLRGSIGAALRPIWKIYDENNKLLRTESYSSEYFTLYGLAVGTMIISTTLPTLTGDGTVAIPQTDTSVKTKDIATTFPLDYTKDTPISIPVPDISEKILNKIREMIKTQEAEGEQDIPKVEVPKFPDMPDLALPNLITTKFPFCIPFDLVKGIRILVANPEPPKVDTYIGTTFQGREIGGDLVLDFKIFEPAARLIRWISTISFTIFLLFATKKLMGGGS